MGVDNVREILMSHWDPIGVAGEPAARGEYDAYAQRICGSLGLRQDRGALVDYLWRIETEHMGLRGNRERAEGVADRILLALSDSSE